jgi:2-haloacid dehalogenase
MIARSGVRALTFDCYGTLVDWESGIVRDLKAGLITRFGKPVETVISDEELLRLFAMSEPAAQSVAYKTYKEVLKTTLDRVAAAAHLRIRDLDALWKGLPSWEPFEETNAALTRLASAFSIGVVTNCDRDLFAETAKRLGTTPRHVVTAEDVGAYKPSTKPFEEMLARLAADGIPKEAVVHVSCSKYHDVAPAKRLGLTCALIERPALRRGGATPTATDAAAPDATYASLTAFADAILGPAS